MHPMHPVRRFVSVVWLLVVAALPACFLHRASAAEATGSKVLVYVSNDLLAPSEITVHLVPDTGAKQTLGLVRASSHMILNARAEPGAGHVRLVAQPHGAPDIVSPAFVLANAAAISWDLRQNVVELVPRNP